MKKLKNQHLDGYTKINLKTMKYAYAAQQNISISIVGTEVIVVFKTETLFFPGEHSLIFELKAIARP